MVTAAMVPKAKGEQDMHYPALRGVFQNFPDNKTAKRSGFVAPKSSISRQTCSRSWVWREMKGSFPGAKTTKLTACRFASSDVERLLHVVRLATAVCHVVGGSFPPIRPLGTVAAGESTREQQ